MQQRESSSCFHEVKIMKGKELSLRPPKLEATEEKDASSPSQEEKATEENDSSSSSQELKSMEEEDSSLGSQDQYSAEEGNSSSKCQEEKAMEENDSSPSSQELKAMKEKDSSMGFQDQYSMEEGNSSSICQEEKAMEENDSCSSCQELKATEEKDSSLGSRDQYSTEEGDSSSTGQEENAMEENDSSLGSQDQYSIEEGDSFLSYEELKAIEAKCLGFRSPGRQGLEAIRIPNGSSSAAANAASSATTPNDFTKTISALPPHAAPASPAFSSNAQSALLWSEGGGNSSFTAATALGNRSGLSSKIADSALSNILSVPHLDISRNESSSAVTIWSLLNAVLLQEGFDSQDATAESQEHQFPNTEETSDPKISLQEPNQQTTRKDSPLSVTTGAQLPNCAVNAEEDPKDLPVMRITRVLRGIPHCPHFILLRGFSDLAIAKLVAAWDQTFEALVDEIQSLGVEDFWFRAFQLWETMDELQELGYNVLSTRIRFVEMWDLMEELKQLKLEIQSWKNEAEEDRLKAIECEMEIFDLKAWVEDEEEGMVSVEEDIKKLEKELPKYDDFFAKVAKRPF